MKALCEKIELILQEKGKALISIEGGAGSGKTTLATALQQKLGGNVYHMDDFFLPMDMRTPERLTEPGGNVHYERFFDEVVEGIFSDERFSYGVYDCGRDCVRHFREIRPDCLHIVEGVYSAHPYYEEIYDLRIFLNIDYQTQRKRILARDREKAEMFFTRWIPMENRYFEIFRIKEKSDIIL